VAERMKFWMLDVPPEAKEQTLVEGVSISNTGHIVIKLRDGVNIVQEIADGIGGPTWLNVPIAITREMVILVRKPPSFKGEF
jgi:hypothetical protein